MMPNVRPSALSLQKIRMPRILIFNVVKALVQSALSLFFGASEILTAIARAQRAERAEKHTQQHYGPSHF
jgi:hypothetical protein